MDGMKPEVSAATPSAGWAELALALGGFGIGTTEFVTMGLLPEIADGLQISIPQAGHVISIYALGVVVGAPTIAMLAARWSRQRLLIALMACFALGNLASALAGGYLSLSLFRFISGLPHGAYFGVASLVAASLAPPQQRARAVGRMMLGLSVATLAGVPLATWLGQQFGWRAAFLFVSLIGTATCVAIHCLVPHRPGDPQASPLRELHALRRPQVLVALAVGAIGFGGLFSVFSYIAPTMTRVAGLPTAWVPVVLALFGGGMILGNLVGARLADRSLLRAINGSLVWSSVVLAAFAFTAHWLPLALINAVLIGSVVALGPALQVRLMDVAGDAQTLAAAGNHAALNVANALGAWLGGLVIAAGLGWTATAWVGALLSLAGLLLHLAAARDDATTAAPRELTAAACRCD